jgi:hypothetical protein
MKVSVFRAIAELVQAEAESDDQQVSITEIGSEGIMVTFKYTFREFDRWNVALDGSVHFINSTRKSNEA